MAKGRRPELAEFIRLRVNATQGKISSRKLELEIRDVFPTGARRTDVLAAKRVAQDEYERATGQRVTGRTASTRRTPAERKLNTPKKFLRAQINALKPPRFSSRYETERDFYNRLDDWSKAIRPAANILRQQEGLKPVKPGERRPVLKDIGIKAPKLAGRKLRGGNVRPSLEQ